MALAQAEAIKRPRDPWVFRCVLDKRPRMVVIALHENLWVAYDATSCSLYKAWKGDVDLQGAVYTNEHGPQPKVRGQILLEQPGETTWHIVKAGDAKEPAIKMVWKGYRFDDEHVTLLYEFTNPDGSVTGVRETMEVKAAAAKDIELVREIRVENAPDDVRISLAVPTLQKSGQTASLTVNQKQLELDKNAATVELEVQNNATTVITCRLAFAEGGGVSQ